MSTCPICKQLVPLCVPCIPCVVSNCGCSPECKSTTCSTISATALIAKSVMTVTKSSIIIPSTFVGDILFIPLTTGMSTTCYIDNQRSTDINIVFNSVVTKVLTANTSYQVTFSSVDIIFSVIVHQL